MALATRCPHCNALFRVAAEQLRSRGGMVRCGACRGVFNAIAGLDYLAGERLDGNTGGPASNRSTRPAEAAAAGTGVRAQPAAVAAAAAPPAPAGAPVVAAAATPPTAETAAAAPAPDADAAPAPRPERRRQPRGDAAVVRAAAPPPPPEAAGGDAEFSGNTLTVFSLSDPVSEAPEAAADDAEAQAADQPSFLRGDRAPAGGAVHWALAAGSVVMAAVLLVQLTLIYRTRLQVAWPGMRPALEALCAPLSCAASWPMRPDLLAVVSSELQALPGTDAMDFTAVLRSRADFALELPAIELTLTDSLNRPVARKVFLPADYHAEGAAGGNLPAGADLSVHLLFELPGVSAAGFEAYPFYP